MNRPVAAPIVLGEVPLNENLIMKLKAVKWGVMKNAHVVVGKNIKNAI